MFKATHDLAAARRLGSKRAPLLDIAVYHCQQSAEKAIKGFLVYSAFTPPKSHNIGELTKLALGFTPLYGILTDAADRLTPFATGFRYPGALLEPSRAEYEQALADAAEFLRVTLSLTPHEAHPLRRRSQT